MATLNATLSLFQGSLTKVKAFTGELQKTAGKVEEVAGKIAKLAKRMDGYFDTAMKLSLVNDGLQSQAELQDKIFGAANRSRSAYEDMVSAVVGLKNSIGDLFKNNDEMIAFAELAQKSFRMGGANPAEQSAAMEELISGMTSDGFSGDQFMSIVEKAPIMLDALSQFTGKSQDELRKMADEGEMTADILKNAMFAMSDEINKSFQDTPKTFANMWERISNSAFKAFQPIIEGVQQILNSSIFMGLVDSIIIGISLISAAVGGLIGFIKDNWDFISFILLTIGLYLAVTLIPAFIGMANAAFLAGKTALTAGLQAAIAWGMANAPLVVLLGTLALMIYMLMEAGVTFQDVFEFIGSIIGATVAIIYNIVWGVVEFIMGILQFLMNPFLAFSNFIANLFVDPISAVIYLFQGLADTVLGLLHKIASAIDFVFGSHLADSISITRAELKQKADDAVKSRGYDPKDFKKDKWDFSVSDFGLERAGVGDTAQAGGQIGKNLYSTIEDKLTGLKNAMTGEDKEGFYSSETSGFSNFANNSFDKPIAVEGTGHNSAVKVDMSDENIKYLQDIAERDYINKFSTATLAPNVAITFGDVHKEADADKIASRIRRILQEQIAVAGEG